MMMVGIEDTKAVSELARTLKIGEKISERKETQQLYKNFADLRF